MKNTVIIKIGGSALTKNKDKFISYIKKLSQRHSVVIVHGGGPEINLWLKILKIKPKFVQGLRFTDGKTMEVVTMVLAGKVNKELTAELNRAKIPAVGLAAADGKMVLCNRLKKLGFVGEPIKINPKIIVELSKAGYIPVISSIGLSSNYKLLNINADVLATSLACELRSDILIFITDVPGVLDSQKRSIKLITEKSAKEFIKNRIITGGMLPKVKSCLQAVKKGVGEVVITNLESEGTVIRAH